jgi:hypothetical protein
LRTLTPQVFNLMTFRSADRRRRLLTILCALLTLWAAFDSPVLLLASYEIVPPASPNPSPSQEDDDDDYVLDLTGKPATCRGARRNALPLSPRLRRPMNDTTPCFSLSCHRQPPSTSPCEHAYRNGIGAPLLC